MIKFYFFRFCLLIPCVLSICGLSSIFPPQVNEYGNWYNYFSYGSDNTIWPGMHWQEQAGKPFPFPYHKQKKFNFFLNKQWMFRKPPSKDDQQLSSAVKYQAGEAIVFDAKQKVLSLQGGSVLDYDEIKLEADKITLHLQAHTITAEGKKDHHNQPISNPILYYKQITKGKYGKEADNKVKTWTFFSDKMHYNIHSKRALIDKLLTKQEDSIIKSETVKKEDDKETFYAKDMVYTTCGLAEPHFYIRSSRTKLIQDQQVTSGPFSLYFDRVPTPLGCVFGTLFLETKRSYGVICPTMSEDSTHGFGVKEGGIYVNFKDYADLLTQGSLYADGTWGVNNVLKYTKRYGFEGGMRYECNRKMSSKDGSGKGHQIKWNHTTKKGGSGSGTFNAELDFRTDTYNALAEDKDRKSILNSKQKKSNGSLSYSKKVLGTMVTMQVKYDKDHKSSYQEFILPRINFVLPGWEPFKHFKKGESNRWFAFNKFSLKPSIKFENFIKNHEKAADQFTSFQEADKVPSHYKWNRYVTSSMHPEVRCEINTKCLQHLNVTYFLNLKEIGCWKKLIWKEGADVPIQKPGFYRIYQHNLGIDLSTTYYCTNKFDLENWLQGFQIKTMPSIGFTYFPHYKNNTDYFYKGTKNHAFTGLGIVGDYDLKDRRQSILKFKVDNAFTIKTRREVKSDKKGKKEDSDYTALVRLVFETKYDFHKKRRPLGDIDIEIKGQLPPVRKNISLAYAFHAKYDPYLLIGRSVQGDKKTKKDEEAGMVVPAWQNGAHMGSLKHINLSVDLHLSPSEQKEEKEQAILSKYSTFEQKKAETDKDQATFEEPWNLKTSFYLSYDYKKDKPFSFLEDKETDKTMYIEVDGGFALVKKWKIEVASKYNFRKEKLDEDFTKISIVRDLHCWKLAYGLYPLKGKYSFDLGVKANILKVLKLPRRERTFTK